MSLERAINDSINYIPVPDVRPAKPADCEDCEYLEGSWHVPPSSRGKGIDDDTLSDDLKMKDDE